MWMLRSQHLSGLRCRFLELGTLYPKDIIVCHFDEAAQDPHHSHFENGMRRNSSNPWSVSLGYALSQYSRSLIQQLWA